MLRLENITKTFEYRSAGRKQILRAVDNVSVEVRPGEVHGIVGESGSGKSTLARVATRLYTPEQGRIWWQDRDITHMSERELRPLRSFIQMVFQDPFSSLNPRMRVGAILREPLLVHKRGSVQEQQAACAAMLERVGLESADLDKYPHQFSGGQRQRICIARALMLRPQIVVADEAVSALDVSIQAQILALMQELKRDFGLAYLFITHDLEVVRLIADRITVMQNGKVVESGTVDAIFNNPREDYTRKLLTSRPSAVPPEQP